MSAAPRILNENQTPKTKPQHRTNGTQFLLSVLTSYTFALSSVRLLFAFSVLVGVGLLLLLLLPVQSGRHQAGTHALRCGMCRCVDAERKCYSILVRSTCLAIDVPGEKSRALASAAPSMERTRIRQLCGGSNRVHTDVCCPFALLFTKMRRSEHTSCPFPVRVAICASITRHVFKTHRFDGWHTKVEILPATRFLLLKCVCIRLRIWQAPRRRHTGTQGIYPVYRCAAGEACVTLPQALSAQYFMFSSYAASRLNAQSVDATSPLHETLRERMINRDSDWPRLCAGKPGARRLLTICDGAVFLCFEPSWQPSSFEVQLMIAVQSVNSTRCDNQPRDSGSYKLMFLYFRAVEP